MNLEHNAASINMSVLHISYDFVKVLKYTDTAKKKLQ